MCQGLTCSSSSCWTSSNFCVQKHSGQHYLLILLYSEALQNRIYLRRITILRKTYSGCSAWGCINVLPSLEPNWVLHKDHNFYAESHAQSWFTPYNTNSQYNHCCWHKHSTWVACRDAITPFTTELSRANAETSNVSSSQMEWETVESSAPVFRRWHAEWHPLSMKKIFFLMGMSDIWDCWPCSGWLGPHCNLFASYWFSWSRVHFGLGLP